MRTSSIYKYFLEELWSFQSSYTIINDIHELYQLIECNLALLGILSRYTLFLKTVNNKIRATSPAIQQ